MEPTKEELRVLKSALDTHHKVSHATCGEIALLEHAVKRLFNKGLTKEAILTHVNKII